MWLKSNNYQEGHTCCQADIQGLLCQPQCTLHQSCCFGSKAASTATAVPTAVSATLGLVVSVHLNQVGSSRTKMHKGCLFNWAASLMRTFHLSTTMPPSLASLFISSGSQLVLGSTPMALITNSAPYDLPLLRCTVTGQSCSSPSSRCVLEPLLVLMIVGCAVLCCAALCCRVLWATQSWYRRFEQMFVTSTPYSRVMRLALGLWGS